MKEMDVQLVVLFLLFISFINFFINIKLIKIILKSSGNEVVNLLEDTILPEITGYNYHSKQLQTITEVVSDKVLIFLQTNCPKCKSKLSRVVKIIERAAQAQVDVKIVLYGSETSIERFVGQHDLKSNILQLSQGDYLNLNPRQISPAYMFVNEQNEIEAQGMIDDENWQYFYQNIINVPDA
ncbi:hypothetical protein [Pseudoalteromonas spongiae]|uniref:Redoxin domain-containing protein n=1 Tax=Pseudoalteromonas spongiae TaxID=298657 RepID=A0ABU8EVD3_9GAMM|nr:hypothetical protein [Pseudoalteromonas spongiae]